MSEAAIHFELHRHLANSIDDSPHRGSRTYDSARPEYGNGINGFADLVVFDTSESPVLVIEAKRPSGSGGGGREIDPYSPKVIRQAHDYASELGSPYFATYNGERLVLFRTFERGRQLLQRSTKSYNIGNVEKFADTLLDEINRLETEQSNWDSLDDAFIERIDSFHEQITPDLRTELTDYLDTDEDFRDKFTSWADAQGFEYNDSTDDEKREIRENVATQAAYLLINKIIFYKILESSSAYGSEVRPLAVSIHRVREDLEDHFTELVSNIDFEAIFEHDDIYSEIPLKNVSNRVREFIIELDDQDLTQFDSDVIGRIYEGVIPPERRHEMGEYYTPPAVCDLITQLTINDANDVVLDPACGSGGFLVSAYNRKQKLLPESAGSHTRILDQLHGIDINRFPAHLTAINLAIQDLSAYTERVNIEVSDFFNVTADTMRFGREQASASGENIEEGIVEETIGGVDAIVGNPPYIRGRNIDNKDRVRSHLSGVDGEFISKRMDMYGYFITHGTKFLSDGGRFGFIISDRWLDTGYGADLQQFILNHYEIESVVKFERQTFEDALVGASIIILTKQSNPTKRDKNTVKFLRIRESIEIDDIVSIIGDNIPESTMVETPEYRLVTQTQQNLQQQSKWNVHFLAPPLYFDLVSNEDIIELQDIAEIKRGLTSGANAFYYGKKEEWRELGLSEYTTPLLKATGQLTRIRFSDDDSEEWGVLDIHRLVEAALDEMDSKYEDKSPVDGIKRWLIENGHQELAEYIEWGENKGYDERRTTSARDIWFDLGQLDRPQILMTDFTWRMYRAVWNEAGATSDAQFYNLSCKEEYNEKLLAGILNSRLAWLMIELRGRWAGGQGMTRARIKVYEAEELPVPDPSVMTEDQKQLIQERFESLMQREDELDEDKRTLGNTENERDKLDKAVLATLGMEDRLDELKQSVRKLVAMREKDAGKDTEVLIERVDDREVIDLAGVSETREITTFSDFD